MSASAAPVPPRAVTERMTSNALWALAITSVAVFMVTLDDLVVTTAIPVIRQDLHAGLSGLQWTVNAYTLTFAVLLMTGAALGDRFGRRRLLAIGVAMFTAASAAAALAPSIVALDVARALQGVGSAIVLPFDTHRPLRRGAGSSARGRARHLGRHQRARSRARAARRRRDRQRHLLLALDLLAQRTDRARARPVHPAAS